MTEQEEIEKNKVINNEIILERMIYDFRNRLLMLSFKELNGLTKEDREKKIKEQSVEIGNKITSLLKEVYGDLPEKPIFKREYGYFQKRRDKIKKEIFKLQKLISKPLEENDFKKMRLVVWKYKRKLRKTILEKDWLEDPTQLNEYDFLYILDVIKEECRIDYHWTRRKR